MHATAWHAHTILEQQEKSSRKCAARKAPERTSSPSLTSTGLRSCFPERETEEEIPRGTVILLMFRSKVKETQLFSLLTMVVCAGSKNCFVSRISGLNTGFAICKCSYANVGTY